MKGSSSSGSPSRGDRFALIQVKTRLPPAPSETEYQEYVQKSPLGGRLLDERDVEAYDWDNQAFVLTPEAARRLGDGTLPPFVACLGSRQRLFGGHGMRWISAMLARHPVIYTLRMEGRTVLIVAPSHETLWQESASRFVIAFDEAAKRFESLGKLRRPHSEPSFTGLDAAVHRISGLSARAGEKGVEVELELDGKRRGEYLLTVRLSLRRGRSLYSTLPADQKRKELAIGKRRSRIVFPWKDVKTHYERYALAPDTLLSKGPAQLSVSVKVQPVLGPVEKLSIWLVDRHFIDSGRLLSDSRTSEPIPWTAVPRTDL